MAKGLSINKYILPIVLVGGFGVVAYFLLSKSTGGKEALGTLGGWFKNATDAINSTGSAIGGSSNALQKAPGGIFNRLNDWFDADRAKDFRDSQPLRDAIESTLDFGANIQRGVGILPPKSAGGGRSLNPKKPTRFDSPRYDRASRLNPALHQKA